jgi:hypothetical protein
MKAKLRVGEKGRAHQESDGLQPFKTEEHAAGFRPLSAAEQKVLRECEAIIARGWETFLAVGGALQRIQNNYPHRKSSRKGPTHGR